MKKPPQELAIKKLPEVLKDDKKDKTKMDKKPNEKKNSSIIEQKPLLRHELSVEQMKYYQGIFFLKIKLLRTSQVSIRHHQNTFRNHASSCWTKRRNSKRSFDLPFNRYWDPRNVTQIYKFYFGGKIKLTILCLNETILYFSTYITAKGNGDTR